MFISYARYENKCNYNFITTLDGYEIPKEREENRKEIIIIIIKRIINNLL